MVFKCHTWITPKSGIIDNVQCLILGIYFILMLLGNKHITPDYGFNGVKRRKAQVDSLRSLDLNGELLKCTILHVDLNQGQMEPYQMPSSLINKN